MKKLFDKVGGKKRETPSLIGKVVLVGQYSVKVEALIGEGGFASIYRCVDMRSGHTFALKHMRLGADADAIKEVQKEAKTMARLKGHPNILNLHAVAFAGPAGGETDGFMLLDYCPTTLLEVMQRTNFVLDDFLVYEVFQDVVLAVAHMHSSNPPLAHRDLKAENVLRNSEGRWVICDFGSSTARAQVYDTPAEIASEEDNIRRTTTPAYRAPEMWDLYSRQRIDTAVDVWALGVLLYVLAFGKLPFQGDSKLSILYGKYDMPAGRPAAMRSLIQDMLQVNPKDRPDIFQVVSKLDILRHVLSGEAHGDGPPAPAARPALPHPPPPQPQPRPQQPPPQQPQPQPQSHQLPPSGNATNSHPQHPQQQQQQQTPQAPGGVALLPYPAAPHPQQPQLAPSPYGQTQSATSGPAYPSIYPPLQQQQQGTPGGPGSVPPGPLQQHLQRMAPPQPQQTVNGQQPAGGPPQWPNGTAQSPQPYSAVQPHVPAHMQPQQQQHAGPQPHQPHPSPYPAPLQPHQPPSGGPAGQPGQSPYGPGGGAYPGAGPPRPTAAPPVQRTPSRQSSFNPNWPASQQPPQPQQPQQPQQRPPPPQHSLPPSAAAAAAGCGSLVTSAPQLVDLMDAAIEEPVPAAPAAASVTAAAPDETFPGAPPPWETGFPGGDGPTFGAAANGVAARRGGAVHGPEAAGAGPEAAAPARTVQVLRHGRSGSFTELPPLQTSSSPRPAGDGRAPVTASAVAVAGRSAGAVGPVDPFLGGAVGGPVGPVGFGDDNVDWGDQPAFSAPSVIGDNLQPPQQLSTTWPQQQHQHPQHPQHPHPQPSQAAEAAELLLQIDSLPLASSGSTSGLPPAPQSAGVLHSSANSMTSQKLPLLAAALPASDGVPPGGASCTASNASAAAGESSGEAVAAAAATSAAAGGQPAAPVRALLDAGEAARGEAAPPLEMAAADLDSFRTALQRVVAANSHLEGRVRQLEGVVSSQGALIQRLVSELRTLKQQQQQPQEQTQAPLQPSRQQPQQQPTTSSSHLPTAAVASKPVSQLPPHSQQLPHHSQQQQPQAPTSGAAAAVTAASLSGGSATSLARLASDGLVVASPGGPSGGQRGGGGHGTAAGGEGARVGGGPISPGRAAPPVGFDPEPWDTFGNPSASSGSAIYPPLRYEDLAGPQR